jgi:formylglycine-generating enzyme required for sulfatase activity
MSVRLVAATCVLSALPVFAIAGADQQPAIDQILERAGQYVSQFLDQFSNVVAEERYVQDTLGTLPIIPGRGVSASPRPASRHRELKSDFLLVKVGPFDWLPFRDVYEVDGASIRDREGRLAKLFLQPSATALEQAQKIALESARYNIGAMQRTINTPILSLMFLQVDMQPRFRFSLGKRDTEVGEHAWVVQYKEEVRPTVIRGLRDSDMPTSGRLWIDTETGRVAKTELNVDTSGVRAHLTTVFRRDERFQIDVPFELHEQYFLDRGQVTGTATYSHFRRFDVSADETFHNPGTTITEPKTGATLIEIPSGRFTMGSPASETGRGGDETLHDVTINHPFFMGQHEVTQQEWRAVMNTQPSHFSDCGPRCPVENVSLADIEQFLAALNAQSGNRLVFRLPTESEWEYACRAGTSGPFATGNTLTTGQANYNGKRGYADAAPGMFRERTTRAAGFPDNPWGLADMHGNVAELTSDWYGPYPAGDVSDPHGSRSGEARVVRGGSWQTDASATRCAARSMRVPTARDSTVGFRLAADPVAATQ